MSCATITIEDLAGGGVWVRTEGVFGPDPTAAAKLAANIVMHVYTDAKRFMGPLAQVQAAKGQAQVAEMKKNLAIKADRLAKAPEQFDDDAKYCQDCERPQRCEYGLEDGANPEILLAACALFEPKKNCDNCNHDMEECRSGKLSRSGDSRWQPKQPKKGDDNDKETG